MSLQATRSDLGVLFEARSKCRNEHLHELRLASVFITSSCGISQVLTGLALVIETDLPEAAHGWDRVGKTYE